MATAQEIIQRLNAGEVVYLNSSDAGEFMLECHRHSLSCGAIRMRYQHGRCRMELTREGRKRLEVKESCFMNKQGFMAGEDRYKALGVPYPDPETMCAGPCEGLGVYPHREPDRLSPHLESQFTPERRAERELWLAAHNAPDAHATNSGQCDGYHFIKCPDCNGTGKLNDH